jgi:hypothetical protein
MSVDFIDMSLDLKRSVLLPKLYYKGVDVLTSQRLLDLKCLDLGLVGSVTYSKAVGDYFEDCKHVENNFYSLGLMYLRELKLHRLVLIKLKTRRKNVFITVESCKGRVLYYYSFGMLFKKSRGRVSKSTYKDVGKRIGEYLKGRRILKVLLCLRRFRVWRYKRFYKELKRHVLFLGRVFLPVLHIGKRKVKRYKRKKSTRRFR